MSQLKLKSLKWWSWKNIIRPHLSNPFSWSCHVWSTFLSTNCLLPLHCWVFQALSPVCQTGNWTMWKTPTSTADKSRSRVAGVKPGSVDIPRCLMAPNELNGVCVTSGRQSCCWYQIELLTSHFPRCTFPLFPPVMLRLSRCQCSELLCWSLIDWAVISGGILTIIVLCFLGYKFSWKDFTLKK